MVEDSPVGRREFGGDWVCECGVELMEIRS